uniref:NADH-ubiquinone oxidoreductase chain 2 n=1 Tax=Reishia clavigera TaxID=272940 RepID=A9NI33_REICL|nr:NADH dehydrogenase subunit 2 [Reishia clavigera]AAZ74634.1 NADH dehydrogenase subunit 2 [Reishia clavigera]
MFSVLPFSYIFMMVMVMGTLLSVSSFHWLSIWAGLEINLIGFLPLLVYQKSTSESESAVKYFIVQALGSSMLIFGSLIAFNMSFTWDLYTSSLSHSVGLLVILSGLCMKLGLFPFHYWLPSVMAGLPWITCLFLATWQKFAPLFLFLCLLELSESYMLILSLCVISAGSSIVGGIGGMNQTQVRALLAYSSIGHLGWMTFALLHSEWSMKFYLLVYVLVSLFVFISLWGADLGTMKDISSLKNFSFVQMSVMLFLLSLGGLTTIVSLCFQMISDFSEESKHFSLCSVCSYFGFFNKPVLLLKLVFLSTFKKYKSEKHWGLDIKTKQNNALALAVSFNLVGGVMIAFSNLFYIL